MNNEQKITKTKIIFLGTPKFGAIILEGIIKNNYRPVLVVTSPDKPVGRKQVLTPSPVKIIAQKYNIPLIQPSKIKNSKSEIENIKPDLIILAAYGQILPREILETPKFGCLNIHPSLLPKYRGASPIQSAILNNDQETGITIILMDERIDHGLILAQREWEIPKPKTQIPITKATYEELNKELAELGAKLLIETIPKWINGKIKPQPQDESKATYTKLLNKENGRIIWKKSAGEIERQIRAFHPWPGSFCFWQKPDRILKIKILKAKIVNLPNRKNQPIGKTSIIPKNELGVKCAKDFLIIEKLQLEGKKLVSSKEFLMGHSEFIGTILQ